MTQVGSKAPAFSLPDETNKMRSLDEFKGKKIVLYFYPKDNTPGCTAQACQLRDAYAEYKKQDIVILGVSFDSVESHAKFKAEHHLPFPLLSDSNKEVAALYGANKGLMGYLITNRTTVLIDEAGMIVQIFENVDVKTHSDKILQAFASVSK